MIEVPRPDIVEEPEESLGEQPSGAERPISRRHSAAPNGVSAAQRAGNAKAREPVASSSEQSFVFDAISPAISAPDPQSFLLHLIGALGRTPRSTADSESSLGTMLRHLGQALDEDLDEELAFLDLVDALYGRQYGDRALNEAVPVLAAFLARIVSAPARETGLAEPPAQIAALVRAAAQVVRSALESGGVRSWCALPELATNIARRAAQRNLSVDTLAAALPRVWVQRNSDRRNASTPPSDRFREKTKNGRHRMVLNGPVEIVILER